MLKTVEVLSHADPRFGGIVSSARSLTSALYDLGTLKVTVAVFSREKPPSNDRPVEVLRVNPFSFPIGGNRPRTDVIHLHGLWEPHMIHATAWGRTIPLVVSAHGMLDAWALSHKKFKKACFSALIQRPRLGRAVCLRALTDAEAAQYRSYGLRQSLAVIPNGVDLPDGLSAERFYDLCPEARHRRIVLFLGRLHHKKGIDLLCRAWSSVVRTCPDAFLVLAGPECGDTPVRAMVDELGLRASVKLTGMLDADQKLSALAAASWFILPSRSEGLSMAVLEALAAGVPVIISPACNLPRITESGCGLAVTPTVAGVVSALTQAVSASEVERSGMAARGRSVVEREYTWSRVAAMMRDVYHYSVGGPKPSTCEFVAAKEA
jgi:glycosyltransferase involved in cell wall biosynthesis